MDILHAPQSFSGSGLEFITRKLAHTAQSSNANREAEAAPKVIAGGPLNYKYRKEQGGGTAHAIAITVQETVHSLGIWTTGISSQIETKLRD